MELLHSELTPELRAFIEFVRKVASCRFALAFNARPVCYLDFLRLCSADAGQPRRCRWQRWLERFQRLMRWPPPRLDVLEEW